MVTSTDDERSGFMSGRDSANLFANDNEEEDSHDARTRLVQTFKNRNVVIVSL